MEYLFPNRCRFCGRIIADNNDICTECKTQISDISGETCMRCGLEIPYCSCKIGDFAFERNIAPYHYDGAPKKLVKRMKFTNKPQLAVDMGRQMAGLIAKAYDVSGISVITYVPMTRIKRMKRGYNQAQLLAESIGECLGIPVTCLLSKKSGVRQQKFMNRRQRMSGVRGKFRVIADVNGMTVLLIDDVMTTGSTLSECAIMLRHAGAQKTLCSTFSITCKK